MTAETGSAETGSPAPPTPAPSGTWRSVVTTDTLLAGVRGIGAVFAEAGSVWWLQSSPSEGGRVSLWRRDGDAEPIDLTPEHYIRTAVHEYGGGEVDVVDGVAVFSSWPDHRLFRLDGTGITAITPADAGVRYADLRVHPDRDLVLAVREDHRGEGEPVNEIVALRLSGDTVDDEQADIGRVLCSGADFYASPELAEHGGLAWIEWDHPNMPWDTTRLGHGRLAGDGGSLEQATVLIDGAGRSDDDGGTEAAGGESVTHPRWVGEDLIVVSDRSGWGNLYRITVGGEAPPVPLCPVDHDFADPMWQLGGQPYVIAGDVIVCRWLVDGRYVVGTLPVHGGRPTVLADGLAAVGSLAVDGIRIAAHLSYDDHPAEVVVLAAGTGEALDHPVVRAADDRLPAPWTSVAESVWWDGADGSVQGWYYAPTHPDHTTDGPPILIVKSHGGPTSMSPSAFRADVQYWTSRGYALLDVNYGGSTGFGRAYRHRLNGRWGLVDVADCIGGAQAMIATGRAHPEKVVITGGSAGGFTTLAALTSADVFAAGISLFGVADLGLLAEHTHKFESRYLDGLVGPWPQDKAVYDERSPINHVDRLTAPMLLFQGTEDKVVPPEQAEVIADAVRARGLPVSLVLYPGEAHGFRKAETIKHHLEAMQAFLGRVLGFTPADPVPDLTIDNLPR